MFSLTKSNYCTHSTEIIKPVKSQNEMSQKESTFCIDTIYLTNNRQQGRWWSSHLPSSEILPLVFTSLVAKKWQKLDRILPRGWGMLELLGGFEGICPDPFSIPSFAISDSFLRDRDNPYPWYPFIEDDGTPKTIEWNRKIRLSKGGKTVFKAVLGPARKIE